MGNQNGLLETLIAAELERARAMHGPTYASHNEAFGVLYEEMQETRDEVRALRQYAEHLCRYVRADDTAGMVDALKVIRKTALNAASEAIQVAAVCSKWMEGEKDA